MSTSVNSHIRIQQFQWIPSCTKTISELKENISVNVNKTIYDLIAHSEISIYFEDDAVFTDVSSLQDKAPQYLYASRQQLRSASRHQLLLIPRYRLRTFGRRTFAVAGPTFWKSLADELRTYSSDRFKLALKTFLFATYLRIQRIRGFRGDALYKLMIDIDIDTY